MCTESSTEFFSAFQKNTESESIGINTQNQKEIETVESNVNINSILKFFLEFQTAIHFNFTRKDVEDINTNLIQLIIDLMLNLFCSFGKNLEREFYLKIINFSDECRKIFNSIKTEHLLHKKLKNY